MEMYASGYDIAAFWDNGDGGGADELPWGEGHMLLDTAAGYRMNPMHFALEMLAKSTGLTMLPLATSADRVHGFAGRNSSVGGGGGGGGDNASVEYFLINKYQVPMPVTIRGVLTAVAGRRGDRRGTGAVAGENSDGFGDGLGGASATATMLPSAVESMVDKPDHWGAVVTSANVVCSVAADTCSFTLPPLSLSRIY